MTTMTQAVPAEVPLLDLKAQYATIRDEVRRVIDAVCDSQRFIGGAEVTGLEAEVAAYSGCKYGIGMSSGTDALLCAMMALGIGTGDEVIVPTFTFFATGGCVSRLGATPVFCDVCPKTFNVRAEHIAPKITPRTKLIVPVHLFGQCADMDPIRELAVKHRIKIMEDGAQSIGSKYKGHTCGNLGDIATLSFFPSKNLGAFGDAGMILCNEAGLAEQCRLLREHGSKPKYYHKFVGANFRLDALQAAVLRVKLKRLDAWTAARRANAALYDKLFAHSPVITPYILPENFTIYNQYCIRVPRRDELKAHLAEMKIGAEIYYPLPLHVQECFAKQGGRPGDLPNAEAAAKEIIALPVYPELPRPSLEHVARAVLDFVRR